MATPTPAELAILRINQTLFGEACGQKTLNDFLPFFANNDVDAVANAYVQFIIDNTDAYKGLEPLDVFKKVLDKIAASNISQADKDALAAEMLGFVDAGLGVGDTINLLSAFLHNSDGDLPDYIDENGTAQTNPWIQTSKQVVNQTEVAAYYTLELKNEEANSEVIENVTDDDTSVEDAKAVADEKYSPPPPRTATRATA